VKSVGASVDLATEFKIFLSKMWKVWGGVTATLMVRSCPLRKTLHIYNILQTLADT